MPPTRLSARLRELRMEGWTGHPITQSRVAEAIGVTAPSVSAYENGVRLPHRHLRDYAAFFASPRWGDPTAPRRAAPDDLTDEERRTFEDLHSELLELSALVDPQPGLAASSDVE